NILVVGHVPGEKYTELTFSILSLDPATKKDVHFLKYPIYVGENKGRGQIYFDSNKSNNTIYNDTTCIGKSIKFDQQSTNNPNVGGFGQGDAEIILQDPLCVQELLFFLAFVILAQIFLVFKKQ
ncbi:hypothetical protein H5410_033033, partial [Solanum commersonii]